MTSKSLLLYVLLLVHVLKCSFNSHHINVWQAAERLGMVHIKTYSQKMRDGCRFPLISRQATGCLAVHSVDNKAIHCDTLCYFSSWKRVTVILHTCERVGIGLLKNFLILILLIFFSNHNSTCDWTNCVFSILWFFIDQWQIERGCFRILPLKTHDFPWCSNVKKLL